MSSMSTWIRKHHNPNYPLPKKHYDVEHITKEIEEKIRSYSKEDVSNEQDKAFTERELPLSGKFVEESEIQENSVDLSL